MDDSVLPHFPCLRPDVQIELEQPSECTTVLIGGVEHGSIDCDREALSVLRCVLPLLDGTRSVSEVCQESACQAVHVDTVVAKLVELGLVFDASMDDDESRESVSRLIEQVRWMGCFSAHPTTFQHRLGQASVCIAGYNRFALDIGRSLCSAGVGKLQIIKAPNDAASTRQENTHTERATLDMEQLLELARMNHCTIEAFSSRGWENENWLPAHHSPDFAIIALAGSQCQPSILRKVNRLLLDRDIPNLLLRVSGTKAIIGPQVVPHRTCCYIEGMEPGIASLDLNGLSSQTEYCNLPAGPIPFFNSLAGLAAAACVDYLALDKRLTYGNALWAFDWQSLEVARYRLLKNPRCPACSRLTDIPEGRSVDAPLDNIGGK